MIKECLGNRYCRRDITDQKEVKRIIEAKVFAELATGIAEEENKC
jgi:hypothetical protein